MEQYEKLELMDFVGTEDELIAKITEKNYIIIYMTRITFTERTVDALKSRRRLKSLYLNECDLTQEIVESMMELLKRLILFSVFTSQAYSPWVTLASKVAEHCPPIINYLVTNSGPFITALRSNKTYPHTLKIYAVRAQLLAELFKTNTCIRRLEIYYMNDLHKYTDDLKQNISLSVLKDIGSSGLRVYDFVREYKSLSGFSTLKVVHDIFNVILLDQDEKVKLLNTLIDRENKLDPDQTLGTQIYKLKLDLFSKPRVFHSWVNHAASIFEIDKKITELFYPRMGVEFFPSHFKALKKVHMEFNPIEELPILPLCIEEVYLEGCPFASDFPLLEEGIHYSVEQGRANAKRIREIYLVRIVKALCREMIVK